MLDVSESLELSNRMKWGFSIICVILIIIHGMLPQITIDSTTLGLLLLLIIPHMIHLLKKVGVTGVGEIEMREFKENVETLKENVKDSPIDVKKPLKIEEGKVTKVGKQIVMTSSIDDFYTVRDPIVSVGAFRTDLERKIREYGSYYNIDEKNFRQVLDLLVSYGGLSKDEMNIIQQLYNIASKAIHLGELDIDAIQFVVSTGKEVIKMLENRIHLIALDQEDMANEAKFERK